MIRRLYNKAYIPFILKLANKISKGIPEEKLRDILSKSMYSDSTIVLADITGDDISSILCGAIKQHDTERVFFIYTTYINPKSRTVGDKFLEYLDKYCKDNNIDKMIAATSRNTKAFERRYRFKYKYAILEREVV